MSHYLSWFLDFLYVKAFDTTEMSHAYAKLPKKETKTCNNNDEMDTSSFQASKVPVPQM